MISLSNVKDILDSLICHITGFSLENEDDLENILLCEKFAWSHITSYLYIDTNSHQLRRTMEALVHKLHVHALIGRSKRLDFLWKRFVSDAVWHEHSQHEIQWRLLDLLIHLSGKPTRHSGKSFENYLSADNFLFSSQNREFTSNKRISTVNSSLMQDLRDELVSLISYSDSSIHDSEEELSSESNICDIELNVDTTHKKVIHSSGTSNKEAKIKFLNDQLYRKDNYDCNTLNHFTWNTDIRFCIINMRNKYMEMLYLFPPSEIFFNEADVCRHLIDQMMFPAASHMIEFAETPMSDAFCLTAGATVHGVSAVAMKNLTMPIFKLINFRALSKLDSAENHMFKFIQSAFVAIFELMDLDLLSFNELISVQEEVITLFRILRDLNDWFLFSIISYPVLSHSLCDSFSDLPSITLCNAMCRFYKSSSISFTHLAANSTDYYNKSSTCCLVSDFSWHVFVQLLTIWLHALYACIQPWCSHQYDASRISHYFPIELDRNIVTDCQYSNYWQLSAKWRPMSEEHKILVAGLLGDDLIQVILQTVKCTLLEQILSSSSSNMSKDPDIHISDDDDWIDNIAHDLHKLCNIPGCNRSGLITSQNIYPHNDISGDYTNLGRSAMNILQPLLTQSADKQSDLCRIFSSLTEQHMHVELNYDKTMQFSDYISSTDLFRLNCKRNLFYLQSLIRHYLNNYCQRVLRHTVLLMLQGYSLISHLSFLRYFFLHVHHLSIAEFLLDLHLYNAKLNAQTRCEQSDMDEFIVHTKHTLLERLCNLLENCDVQLGVRKCLSVDVCEIRILGGCVREFAITYVVPWPISTLIESHVVQLYTHIFNVLRQLKTARNILYRLRFDECLEYFIADSITRKHAAYFCHRLYLLRSWILHIILSIHNYIMQDVYHCFPWNDFENRILSSTDLDNLIKNIRSFAYGLHSSCFSCRSGQIIYEPTSNFLSAQSLCNDSPVQALLVCVHSCASLAPRLLELWTSGTAGTPTTLTLSSLSTTLECLEADYVKSHVILLEVLNVLRHPLRNLMGLKIYLESSLPRQV